MSLTHWQKIVVGTFTLLPYLLIGFFIVQLVGLMSHTLHDPYYKPENPFVFMYSMIIPILFAVLLSTAILIFYIIHVVKNPSIDSNERLVWILVFVFSGMIGFPIYWFMRIWPSSKISPEKSDSR